MAADRLDEVTPDGLPFDGGIGRSGVGVGGCILSHPAAQEGKGGRGEGKDKTWEYQNRLQILVIFGITHPGPDGTNLPCTRVSGTQPEHPQNRTRDENEGSEAARDEHRCARPFALRE